MANTAPGMRTAMPMVTGMPTESSPLARLRLLQLCSPSLPIGGFTYSQGLEYAVEAGWVRDLADAEDWLTGLLQEGLRCLDVPVLARLVRAVETDDPATAMIWCERLLAARETQELRTEERQRGRALSRLLQDLDLPVPPRWEAVLECCQLAPWALASVHWRIPLRDAALGLAWSWLEGQVAAAIKLVPLGQTDGQRLQLRLAEAVPEAVEGGLVLPDEAVGTSSPLLAIASSLHETQYTRLFRS